MEETNNNSNIDNSDIKTDALSKMVEIIQNDENLCNLYRYMEYGTLTKCTDYNYEHCSTWVAYDSVLDHHCVKCTSNIIRLITRFNSNVLDHITKNIMDVKVQKTSELQSIFNLYNNYSSNISRMSNITHKIQNMMLNIDCNYKINGSSLTALDFLCKDPDSSNTSRDLFKRLLIRTSRLIFIGNKAFLLALIDSSHNVYISMAILQSIYKKDDSLDKHIFTEIVVKLFNVIQRCCIFVLNENIVQYYQDKLISPVINRLYLDRSKLSIDEKISINFITNLSFSDQPESDDIIKNKIIELLKNEIYNILNNENYITNINITELIDWVKRNNNIANEKRVRDAYNTGLALFQILKDCGWKVCNIDDRNDIHCYYASQIFFDREHTYIYKDLEFSPYLAYVSTSGSPEYRMIKEECRDVLSNRVYVRRIYLDVTTGVMYCDGIHPNVNRGSVCMGDIKGKITLSTATKDTVIKMLKDCEELLTVCNYTSPYNHDAEHLFKDPAYSIPAFQTKVETPEETSDSTKDIEKFNEDDIQLISEDDSNDENATQDVQNDIVESEFDEITEENQHET